MSLPYCCVAESQAARSITRPSVIANSVQNLAGKVIVVKDPVHSKSSTSGLLYDSCHDTDTLDAKFLAALIGGRNENFDANGGANRGALATKNQSAIESYVAGEAAFGVFFSSVLPMKNDGQMQLVPNGCASIQSALKNWTRTHS
jgi:hypothetical protein